MMEIEQCLSNSSNCAVSEENTMENESDSSSQTNTEKGAKLYDNNPISEKGPDEANQNRPGKKKYKRKARVYKYGCPFCDSRFFRSKQAQDHMNIHTGQKPYKCSQCDQNFSSEDVLKRHQQDHQLPPIKCEKCGVLLKNLKYYNNHQRIHDPSRKKHVCDICGAQYASKKLLKTHIFRMHKPDVLFPCKFCAKMFNTRELKKHQQSHDEAKTIKCEQCDEKFFETIHLAKHINTAHPGTTRVDCEMCEKYFSTEVHLRRHIQRMHTEKKKESDKFMCDQCPTICKDKNALLSHSYTHRKGHVCPTCDKRFGRSDYLAKHMTVHEDVRPFLCDFCGRAFSRIDNMKKHMKSCRKREKTE